MAIDGHKMPVDVMQNIDPPTSEEILLYIRDRCEEGSVISIGKDFIMVGGKRLWSIRGAGVNAGGYLSLTEAYIRWKEAVEWDRERRANV